LKRHAITITAALLGTIWLAAIAVQLCFIAGLAGIPWLIGSIVAQAAILLVSGAIILVTNTRRPAGIDPNAPHVAVDPFAMSSEDLRNAVLLADNMPYGRRKQDDTAVVKRLIGKFEEEDAQRPPPKDGTPSWALDLLSENEASEAALRERTEEGES
jgi:hypothetical protein